MRICVVGAGYVGLVSGAGFANTGHHVVCLDVDRERIAGLKRGQVPIYEPGLEELIERNLRAQRLTYTDDPAEALPGARVVLVAVGTPGSTDGNPDLSQVWHAGRLIARHIDGPTVIAVKSTVPVGTGDRLDQMIAAETTCPFALVSNPEFLKEGSAVSDFLKPTRAVVGTDSAWAEQTLRELYRPFMRTNDRMLVMDRRSAELTKYACNAYLATRISFVNEVACLCERLGADVELVRQGMGSDPRIGHQFLFPGIGYGGSCFPKDVRALIAMGAASDCPMGIAEAADRANDRQRRRFIERIAHRFDGDLSGRALALWGISFKPGTDDIREAPALTVANALLDRDAEIRAFDPAAAGCAQSYFGGRASIWLDMYAVLQDVDALVVMTEWPEFRNPDFELMRQAMRQPIIFDGRNLYDPKAMARLGFEYHAVGRPMEIGSLAEGGPGAEVTPLTQDAARLSLEATPGGDGQGGRGTVER